MQMQPKKGVVFYDDEFFGNPQYDDENCYVSRTARITGKVQLEDNVIVCPHVSIRADEGSPFKICKGTNIQDSVIIHGLYGEYVEDEHGEKYSVLIGSHCTIAHRATVHGPTKIGKKTFVGFHTIIHNSIVGRNCYIGHGAIVENVTIKDERFVRSGMVVDCQTIADSLPMVNEHQKGFNKAVVDKNKHLVKIYQERRRHHNIER
ncbi:MAG: Carboxysome protein CcmM [Candidatus Moranbacteria bacterium GW2011_GWD2_36_12]|nr:MAG: Carboxysome protein CcmM [Candidatus Moranbacteria bacterium GW2011_GWD2_36_12]KKQ06875.1 MAG: Carboxysome protein CcmM [Candidatus Moranbacteria bacterium GW2011_GWE2_36_40]